MDNHILFCIHTASNADITIDNNIIPNIYFFSFCFGKCGFLFVCNSLYRFYSPLSIR